jgi:hypothetical protein
LTGEEELVQLLVDAFPPLRPLLDEHLDDQFGEVLPYLFLADVSRYLVDLIESGRRQDALPVLDWLERRFRAGSEEEQTLIAAGFLEALPRPDEPGAAVRDALGPALSDELARVN